MVLLLASSLQARQLPSRSAGLATRVKRENKVKLCGDQLIHMLAIICRSSRSSRAGGGLVGELERHQVERLVGEVQGNQVERLIGGEERYEVPRKKRSPVKEAERLEEEEEEQMFEEEEEERHTARRKRTIGLSATCCQSSCTLHQLRLAC